MGSLTSLLGGNAQAVEKSKRDKQLAIYVAFINDCNDVVAASKWKQLECIRQIFMKFIEPNTINLEGKIKDDLLEDYKVHKTFSQDRLGTMFFPSVRYVKKQAALLRRADGPSSKK